MDEEMLRIDSYSDFNDELETEKRELECELGHSWPVPEGVDVMWD